MNDPHEVSNIDPGYPIHQAHRSVISFAYSEKSISRIQSELGLLLTIMQSPSQSPQDTISPPNETSPVTSNIEQSLTPFVSDPIQTNVGLNVLEPQLEQPPKTATQNPEIVKPLTVKPQSNPIFMNTIFNSVKVSQAEQAGTDQPSSEKLSILPIITPVIPDMLSETPTKADPEKASSVTLKTALDSQLNSPTQPTDSPSYTYFLAMLVKMNDGGLIQMEALKKIRPQKINTTKRKYKAQIRDEKLEELIISRRFEASCNWKTRESGGRIFTNMEWKSICSLVKQKRAITLEEVTQKMGAFKLPDYGRIKYIIEQETLREENDRANYIVDKILNMDYEQQKAFEDMAKLFISDLDNEHMNDDELRKAGEMIGRKICLYRRRSEKTFPIIDLLYSHDCGVLLRIFLKLKELFNRQKQDREKVESSVENTQDSPENIPEKAVDVPNPIQMPEVKDDKETDINTSDFAAKLEVMSLDIPVSIIVSVSPADQSNDDNKDKNPAPNTSIPSNPSSQKAQKQEDKSNMDSEFLVPTKCQTSAENNQTSDDKESGEKKEISNSDEAHYESFFGTFDPVPIVKSPIKQSEEAEPKTPEIVGQNESAEEGSKNNSEKDENIKTIQENVMSDGTDKIVQKVDQKEINELNTAVDTVNLVAVTVITENIVDEGHKEEKQEKQQEVTPNEPSTPISGVETRARRKRKALVDSQPLTLSTRSMTRSKNRKRTKRGVNNKTDLGPSSTNSAELPSFLKNLEITMNY